MMDCLYGMVTLSPTKAGDASSFGLQPLPKALEVRAFKPFIRRVVDAPSAEAIGKQRGDWLWAKDRPRTQTGV